MSKLSADAATIALRRAGDARLAGFQQSFYRTEPGGYGEGDRFLGVRVPATRIVARTYRDLDLHELERLLQSEWHEARLCALIIMTMQYPRASPTDRAKLARLYLDNLGYINAWDLVDVSAYKIIGPHCQSDRAPLFKLARSQRWHERRVPIVATFHYIRQNDCRTTFKLSEKLVSDPHDLIHKAVGWMLREAGKRDRKSLDAFLSRHATTMPRIMLRYAIEKHTPAERSIWLARR